MKTVICRIDLGYTRTAGFTLFDHNSLEFIETTPRYVMSLVKAGNVNGLVVNSNGELVPDTEGYNLLNLKIKSGVGNYRDLYTDTRRSDTIYCVVRAYDVENSGRMYEVVNNLCLRVFMTEKKVLGLSMFNLVGGVRIEGDSIVLCKGVEVINIKAGSWEELCNCFIPNDGVMETSETPVDNVIQMPTMDNGGLEDSAQSPESESEPEQEPEQVENGKGMESPTDDTAEGASMEDIFGGIPNSMEQTPEEITDTGVRTGDAPEGEVEADGTDQSVGSGNTAKKDDGKKGSKPIGKKKK